MKTDKLENILCVFWVCLLPLHIYLCYTNFIYGIDKGYGHSYPIRSYALAGLYLLVILSINLFISVKRKFELMDSYSKCWMISSISLFLAFLIGTFFSEAGGIMILLLLCTPFLIFTPFLEYLRLNVNNLSILVVFGFCFANLILCRFMLKLK